MRWKSYLCMHSRYRMFYVVVCTNLVYVCRLFWRVSIADSVVTWVLDRLIPSRKYQSIKGSGASGHSMTMRLIFVWSAWFFSSSINYPFFWFFNENFDRHTVRSFSWTVIRQGRWCKNHLGEVGFKSHVSPCQGKKVVRRCYAQLYLVLKPIWVNSGSCVSPKQGKEVVRRCYAQLHFVLLSLRNVGSENF